MSLDIFTSIHQITDRCRSELYDEIVTVQAGLTKKEFYLHRGLVCHHSTYFQGALRGDWKESKEGIITLDNEDEMTFQKFVDWLYTHRLPHVDLKNRMTWLIRLWLLGDRKGVADLQNQAMDLLMQAECTDDPSPATMKECYDAITTGSVLRKALVNYFLAHMDISYMFSDDYETEYGEWPRDFCREFSIAADAKVPQGSRRYRMLDRCEYHVH